MEAEVVFVKKKEKSADHCSKLFLFRQGNGRKLPAVPFEQHQQ